MATITGNRLRFTPQNTKLRRLATSSFKWIFLVVLAALTIYPVAYAVLGSFKTNQELTLGGGLLPREWRFENYAEAWNIANFGRYIWNSLFICFWVVLGALITASMTAYCITRRDFPGRTLLVVTYTALMFVSIGPLTLRPIFELSVGLGINNSLLPVILMIIGGQAVNIFILQAYIKTIPRELDEAAAIDGASFFRIYWQIVLPLAKPALGVVALFEFRHAWNDYLNALVFTLNNHDLRPLSVGVAALRYNDTAATQWNLMLTGAAISIIPMLIVYFFTNKAFISGLASGALKG
jgi:raffinose/stachyose/melibiose transport system permease protein